MSEYNNTIINKERENWIDFIKGVAIILVVLGHIIDGCVAREVVSGINAQLWTIVYDAIYSFHMPLFMLISGYLYSKYVMKNWKYVLRKAINLISIYMMISILYICIRLMFASNMKSEVNFKQILLLPIMPVGPYWYLWVLIIYYLLFYVGIKYTNKKLMWLFSICISIVAVIVKCQIPNNIYQLMLYSLLFYVGIEFETIYKLFSKNVLYSLFVTILAAISMVLLGLFVSIWSNLLLMFCTAIFVLGLIGLSRMTMIHSIPIVSYLGKNTMIVYLYHVFFVTLYCVVASKIKLDGSVILIIGFCVSLVGPIVILKCMERLGLRDLMLAPVDYISDKFSRRK